MTPLPTDEFENLRKLRERVKAAQSGNDPAYADFLHDALDALGPEGCVTRELERLREERDAAPNLPVLLALRAERNALAAENKRLEAERLFAGELAVKRLDEVGAMRIERDALLAKHNLVSEAYADYRSTTDEVIATLQRHTKDAQKENAYLLARLVKLSAAERELWISKATDVDSAGDRYVMDSALQKLHRVVEEIPPR